MPAPRDQGNRYEEYEVRELLLRAVIHARDHSRSNICDDAVVQAVMADQFIDGKWRSTLARPILDGSVR